MPGPPSTRTLHRHKIARWILRVMIVLLALFLRAAPIGGGLPYLRYVDEGHVLHDATKMLQKGTLDTGFYNYPSLPSYLIAGAIGVYAPIHSAIRSRSFWSDLQRDNDPADGLAQYYDYFWPTDVIVVARIVVLLFSVGTVVLAGMLGRLMGGSRAALLAMLVTALCPALVSRGSIVIVDTIAAFFALAALYFCQRLQPNSAAPWRFAAAAGVAAGLAFVSKYMAGAVFVAVLVRLAIARRPIAEKARLILISGAGLLAGSVMAMPALLTNPGEVVATIRAIAGFYNVISYGTSYWRDAISAQEVGLPLFVAGLTGLALLLHRSRATRVAALSWLAFALVLIVTVGRSSFQPFRNLLPLVPPLCVAAAFLLARGDLWFANAKVRKVVNDWIEPAAALLITLSLAIPAWGEAERQRNIVDSRVRAVDWLQEHARAEERILAIQELAIHPAEWRRLSTKPIVVSWFAALDLVETGSFDHIVSSEFDLQFATDKQVWSNYRDHWTSKVQGLPTAVALGSVPCFIEPGVWRTNDERIVILKGRFAAPQQ